MQKVESGAPVTIIDHNQAMAAAHAEAYGCKADYPQRAKEEVASGVESGPPIHPARPSEDVLLIGQLAQRCGLSTQSIRFYEREGLIAPERAGTFRVYAEADVRRLEAIVALRRMGVSIVRIREIIDVQSQPEGEERDRQVADLLSGHLAELKRRQETLKDEIAATAGALDKLALPQV